MYDINVRGTFFVSKSCIPHLKKSTNAHILNLSPPVNMDMKWFKNHLAYTISKYDMSMIALGLSAELKKYNIAANTIWPRTTIATAAVNNLLGGAMLMNMSRTVDIIADAAYYILRQSSEKCTGNLFIDEDVLAKEGIVDLDEGNIGLVPPTVHVEQHADGIVRLSVELGTRRGAIDVADLSAIEPVDLPARFLLHGLE